MSFWSKLKRALGIARVVSPKVDEVLDKAEQLGAKAEQARETAEQVRGIVDAIQGDEPRPTRAKFTDQRIF